MKIPENFRFIRASKKLYADDNAKGVQAPETRDKLFCKMFAFLGDMENADELRALPSWKAHVLTGRPQRHMEPERHGKPAIDISVSTRLSKRFS